MYEVALTVQACLGAGTHVDVAWVVESDLPSASTEAVAITPGGGRVGRLLSGALDAQVADLAASGRTNRLVSLSVSAVDALVAGLPSAGTARCLVVDGASLPDDLWELLRLRADVVLVSELDGDRVVRTSLAAADAARATAVTDESVTSVFRAVPQLVVVGGGPYAEALADAARLLGWSTHLTTDRSEATGLVAGLSALDQLVVAGHDDELTGAALEAALAGPAGYIGALGPQSVQRSRAEWLAYRGVTDLSRVHGPAGLDIGARTPGEVALAVLAEALAVRSGRSRVEGT